MPALSALAAWAHVVAFALVHDDGLEIIIVCSDANDIMTPRSFATLAMSVSVCCQLVHKRIIASVLSWIF